MLSPISKPASRQRKPKPLAIRRASKFSTALAMKYQRGKADQQPPTKLDKDDRAFARPEGYA